MGNQSQKSDDFSTEYYSALQISTISGTTWIELEKNLREHIKDGGIEREWEKLNEKQEVFRSELSEVGRLPINKSKNRYADIVPLDATRVKLSVTDGGSDYINASHVKLFDKSYICCQAPLPSTIEDFYRMLWEMDCTVVVMLTKLIEDGKVKATEYLSPLNETATYGSFEVTVIKERFRCSKSFLERAFILKKDEEVRTLNHFQFLAWPDHGVPTITGPFLKMIIRVFEFQSSSKSPTVVHCSAGIGRTGTYILITSVLELITKAIATNYETAPPSISFMKMVHQLRGMRPQMINSLDQYEFCYKIVLDHIRKLIVVKVNK